MSTTHPELTTKPVPVLHPASRAANTYEGAAVDTLGFDHALVILHAGTATGELNAKIQEKAASGDSFADAKDDAETPATIAFEEIDSTNDDGVKVMLLRLDRRKRYLTVHATVTTNAVVFGASILLLNARDSVHALSPDDYAAIV